MKNVNILHLLPLLLSLGLPLFLAGQTDQSKGFISDSTEVRYRFEIDQEQVAELPDLQYLDQIDLQELELTKTRHKRQVISQGINRANKFYLEVRSIEASTQEDWMSVPTFQLSTPTGSYGFDSTRAQVYHFPHNATKMQELHALHAHLETEGFRPVMLFFPSKHDDFVQEAINDGAIYQELTNHAFELIYPDHELKIEPHLKRISENYQIDSTYVEESTVYTLLAPYGYVPLFKKEKRIRLDLPQPVTFVTRTDYRNHVIEDLNGSIEKYTDFAHLEVFPNPVQGSFEVLFRGIPDAQVSKVEVRNHLGGLVQSVSSPVVQENILSLDASTYPTGPLILLVHTQHGIYSKNISKI